MQIVGVVGVGRARPELVVLENLQRFDQRGAGRHRRRRRVDLMITISPGERTALDGAILRQIVDGDEAAVFRHVVSNAPGDRSPVERVGAILRNRPKGRGVVLVHEPIASLWHLAVWQIDAGRRTVLFEELPSFGNRRRQRRVELVSALCVIDRRRDELAPGNALARVIPIQEIEAGNDARDVGRRRTITAAGGEQRIVAGRADRDLILVVDRDRARPCP